jgi:hypothetical protein
MSVSLSCRRAVWSVLTVAAVTLAMVAAPGSAEAAPSDGISGTVTSAGHPVQGLQVTACPTAGASCGPTVDTGVDGSYSVSGLAPGDYYVTFRDPTTAYVTQNYPNIIATTAAGPGTPVAVTLGHVTTGINDVAVAGSTFSGIVTGPAGPVADICVLPANADGYVTGVTRCTDSAGRYTTEGLPTGTYHLVFLDYESRFFVPQWYDNLPDTIGQHSTATALTATTPPSNQVLKNVVIQLGGNVSGIATANGGPLANVSVTLFPTGSSGPGLYGAQTDGTGRFTTQSVPPGSYKVGYIDYTGAHLPANTYFYYNNAQTLATAAAVTVTQGQTTALGAQSVPTVPSVPTGVSATAGDRAANVTFTAPASNGGSPITRYTLTPSPACSGCTGLTTTTTGSTVSGLTNGTAYTFRVTATNAVGAGAASAPSNAVTPRAPGKSGFTGVTPVRVLDTRIGLGAAQGKVGAGRTVTLTVPGLPAGTTAVALNVTATGPTADGYLTVYPGGAARHTASNLNFAPGQTIPNMVLVRLGPGNTVTFYNSGGAVDVIADVLGYYAPGTGGGFTGVTPARVLDTRIGRGAALAKVGAGRTVTLTVPGLPAGTTAVALNVTATGPTTGGYLTVYPGGAARPTASNLNFAAGQTIPNMVLVRLGAGNTVTFFNSAGAVNVIADVLGYYAPGTGGGFTGVTPARVLDTRIGLGAAQGKVGAGRTVTLTVPGLPAGTTAVALNVTATGPTTGGYLTVYPGGAARPTASNLNFAAGQTIPNMVLVRLGPGNTVTFYNYAGTVNVIADLLGYSG